MKLEIGENLFWFMLWTLGVTAIISLALIVGIYTFKSNKLVADQPDCISKVIQQSWPSAAAEILALKACEVKN